MNQLAASPLQTRPGLERDVSGADDMSTEEPPTDLTIGEFVLNSRKIGKGSFGKIYEGHSISNPSLKVAIKLEPEDVLKSHLADEYECYQKLTGCVGVPRVYFCGRVGDFNCLVMDLLGPSLERHRGKFSMDQVIILADQCISRLQTLHKHGMVYNDVKPANFLLGLGENAETVYVVDFGLAKLLPDDKISNKLKLQRIVPFEEKQQRDKIKEERQELIKQFGGFLSRESVAGSGQSGNSGSGGSGGGGGGGNAGAGVSQHSDTSKDSDDGGSKHEEDEFQIPFTRQNEILSRDDYAPGLGRVKRQKELLFAPSLASLREAGLLEEEDTMSNLPAPDSESGGQTTAGGSSSSEREMQLISGDMKSKSVAALNLFTTAPGMAGLYDSQLSPSTSGGQIIISSSSAQPHHHPLPHNNNTSMPVLPSRGPPSPETLTLQRNAQTHTHTPHYPELSAKGAHLAPTTASSNVVKAVAAESSSNSSSKGGAGGGLRSGAMSVTVGPARPTGRSIFFWRNKSKEPKPDKKQKSTDKDKKNNKQQQLNNSNNKRKETTVTSQPAVPAGVPEYVVAAPPLESSDEGPGGLKKMWQVISPPKHDGKLNIPARITNPHAPLKTQSAAAVFGAVPVLNKPETHVVGATLETKEKKEELRRKHRGLIGTPRFASVNAHMGVDLVPRDDMESLGFMLVYLAKGKLPWQGIRCQSRQEMYDRILAQKVSLALPELCKDLPPEFIKYFAYLRLLTPVETVDYDYLRLLFSRTKARLAEEREKENAEKEKETDASSSPKAKGGFYSRFFSSGEGPPADNKDNKTPPPLLSPNSALQPSTQISSERHTLLSSDAIAIVGAGGLEQPTTTISSSSSTGGAGGTFVSSSPTPSSPGNSGLLRSLLHPTEKRPSQIGGSPSAGSSPRSRTPSRRLSSSSRAPSQQPEVTVTVTVTHVPNTLSPPPSS